MDENNNAAPPTKSPPTESQSVRLPASKSIENCDAWMIGLQSQRIVIVRRDGPTRLRSAERICKPIQQVKPGETVYYNGRREQVRSVSVF
ncbi:MAG: hypothetical protein AAFU85_21610 [Planctomycetota bacterium]